MADLIQIRRDTAANWTSVNPILESGEIGLETDTELFKIGDGVTAWTSRIYGGLQGETGADGAQGNTGADSTVAGPQGEPGLTGADGADSTVAGPQGETGLTGADGADSTVAGPQGETGLTGADGADSTVAGPQGETGLTGADGADSTVAGPQGETGLTGADGADSTVAGPQGETGLTGADGADSTVAGPQGETGADSTVAGPAGPAGADGDGSGGGAAADTIGTVTVNDLDLSTGNIFEITASDQTISFSGSPDIHEFKVKVAGANVTSGFDLANSAYEGVSASVSSEMTWPAALQFKPDGTKMYVFGNDTQEIFQYTLDPAWDIESRVYDSLSFTVNFSGSTDIAFSPDGDKMFVLSYSFKTIRQYTLGTPWVINTASYDSVSYYVNDEESNPTGLHVSEDGENLYIIGEASDVVYQYTLTTGWDLSTTSSAPIATLDTSGQTNWAGNVYVSPDGLKMYVVGGSLDVIFQYTLTTAFDLSTASYDGIERDITSEEGTPNGITFKPDGFKMYVVGKLSDAVFEYSMTSESIGTVTYPSSVNFLDDTPPTITAIGEVSTVTLYTVDSGANYYPLYGNKGDTGAIGPSGGEQGIQGETGATGPAGADGIDGSGGGAAADTIGTVTVNDLDLSTGNIFEVTAGNQTLSFSGSPAIHEFKVKLAGQDVTTGFQMTEAFYDSVIFSVSGQENAPRSLAFNLDGTKMYIVGSQNSSIYQYTLTTGFDLNTASWDGAGYTFDVSGQDSTPAHLVFSDDGTKLFVVGLGSDSIYQYDLTTGFDLSTASYGSVSLGVSSQDSTPRSVSFNGSGTKMYLIGSGNSSIYQYTLTTGFDLSTASYDSVSFSVNSQESTPTDFVFNNAGTKFFVAGVDDTVYQYSLTTEFDISTSSYDSVSFSVATQEDTLMGFVFNADGTKMYVVGLGNDTVYQYSTSSLAPATINYPSSVIFLNDTPPTLPTDGEVSTVTLYTVDSGANYYPLYGNKGDTGAIGPSGGATGAQGPQGETGPAGSGASSVAELTDVDVTTVAPTNNQVLKYNTTTSKWEPADAASGGGSGATLTNYNFTATEGQTSFSGSDDNSTTLAYTAASLIVTLNGVMLEDDTDYTATDGTTVVLSDAASLNDELNVVAFGGGSPTAIDGGTY